MSEPEVLVNTTVVANAFSWFHGEFRDRLVSSLESQFPNYPLPPEVREVIRDANEVAAAIHGLPDGTRMAMAMVVGTLAKIGRVNPVETAGAGRDSLAGQSSARRGEPGGDGLAMFVGRRETGPHRPKGTVTALRSPR
jgi:hypothetical protein